MSIQGLSIQRTAHREVAVIGAGPYGLAVSARLQQAGVDYVLLGRPMWFWKNFVPRGLSLLSDPLACSLSSDSELGVSAWEQWRGKPCHRPFPGDEFIEYCLWFQRRTQPAPDERTVVNLDRQNGSLVLQLEDASVITADRVIVAAGLKDFCFSPAEFAALPAGLCFHASELNDLSGFCGKTVAAIGSGQSALECAALLHEQNAQVEVIAREDHIRWRPYGGHVRPVEAHGVERYARAAVRMLLNNPTIFRQMPAAVRAWWLAKTLRASADTKLKPRLQSVPMTLGRKISAVTMQNGQVNLHLSDGTSRTVDHIVFGTGYRIDARRIRFLASELRRSIRRYRGYPVLNDHMQSSVPGLYFAGAPAAMNFGTDMWFVHGAPFAADRISRAFADRKRQPAPVLAPTRPIVAAIPDDVEEPALIK